MPDNTNRNDRGGRAPLSRRDFVRLSAATAGALTLAGTATATSSTFDAEYEYVINHTPADYAAPTLVRFGDAAGPEAMRAALDTEVITTTTPEPAAYGRLTAAQALTVADLPTAERLSFSPGSNPFWRLGYYPFGVFPEPRRSVDFVSYEQMVDGLAELERSHPDTMRVREIGQTPGHFNNLTDRDDPKGMYVAEITNDIDDADAFAAKEKVFFSLSLHGLERAGAEAGSRIVENVLRGDDLAGPIPELLDDVVLLLCFTNPDGWVARNPQYDSGWQLGGPGTGIPRAPAAPVYERGNAEVYDTNRQYPTVGYIIPSHYPADRSNFSDDPAAKERVDATIQKVPDALALVDHFRGYENLNYGADLHGGPIFNEFVLGLISQDQYDSREMHEVYEMCRVIDDVLEEALSTWVTAGDAKKALLGDFRTGLLFGVLPEQAFDYGTIYDTIDYTVSGAMLDWMSHPEHLGGLGMTTLDFEMAFSHMTGGNVYNPELIEMEVTGYRTAIRTITKFAYENSDTPNSADQFGVDTETGGESVAYVTTGAVGSAEDALRKSSETLLFDSFREVSATTYSGVVGPGAEGTTTAEHAFNTADFDNPSRLEATLTWTTNTQDLDFYLMQGDSQVAGSENFGGPEQFETTLAPDTEYTFVVSTYANAAATYEITASFQAPADGDEPPNLAYSTASGRVAGGETIALSREVAATDFHSMSVHVHAHEAIVDLELVSPSGEVVHSFDAVTEDRVGGRCCGFPEWVVAAPEPGEWSVRATNRLDEAKHLDVQFSTLSSTAKNPNPAPAVGYDQYDYDVTPFRFFEDYADSVVDGGTFTAVTVEEVANGALVADGRPAYDHVVAVHDYGANADADYFGSVPGYTDSDHPTIGFDAPGYPAALDDYVDAGGNLILTDTGVNLLSTLDNAEISGLSADALETRRYEVARYTEKDLDHPLMTDARPIQNQLWKVAPLGYSVSGEAPMSLVDEAALSEAATNATVAGRTDGFVATATLAGEDRRGVHVISSLLPTATQKNLHPFGLVDYAPTFLGYLVLTSALGFTQIRRTADNPAGSRWGAGDATGAAPVESFTASGARSDDGSTFTGGQTNQVDITVSGLSHDAEITDSVPEGWTVDPRYGDVESVEDGTVSFGTVSVADDGALYRDDPESARDSLTLTYFAEAPEGAAETDSYGFGPATALALAPEGLENDTAQVAGTETNYVAGVSTTL